MLTRSCLIVLLASGIIGAFGARPAYACQCSSKGPASDVRAARDSALLIVEGFVASQGPPIGPLEAAEVRLREVKVHRGAVRSDELRLSNGDECAPKELEDDQRYLFYVNDPESRHINACSRVVAFPDALAELPALAAPHGEPAPSAMERPALSPRAGGCGSCQTGLHPTSANGIVLFALLALFAARIRRASRLRNPSNRSAPDAHTHVLP